MADNTNPNIDPVDPIIPTTAVNKEQFVERYKRGELPSQAYFAITPDVRTTDSDQTFSDITSEQQYNSILNELEKQDQVQSVKDDYDAWYNTAGNMVGSLLFNTAAAIGDTLGMITDPADWRLPTIGGTVDAVSGLFGYDTDVSNYTDYVDPLAWTNKGIEAIDDYTFLGDADKIGNNWTQAAQSLREKSQHFFKLNSGNSWLDAAGNTLIPLAGSIIGALRTGQLTALSGQMAGLSKTANNLLNTFIMTESTGLSIAQDVHDKVYAETLNQLSPELQKLESSAYEDTYNKSIEEGYSKREAEWNALQAVKQARASFAEQNPDLHKIALTNAGRGADVTLKAMAPSFALNLITANLFTRSLYAPRNILSKPTWISGREILKEGIPEALEEGVIENVAEQMGIAYGTKGSYDYKDLSKIIWDSEKKEWNWNTFMSAGLGFLGGGGMAALGSMPRIGDYNERKEAYDLQQTQIQKENKIGESAGISELLDKTTNLQKSLEQVAVMGKEAARLQSEDKIEEANALKSKMLSVQAYEAFNAGTTKNLVDNYNKIANDPKSTPEIQQRAMEAIAEIEQMEQVYKKVKGKYYNDNQVYSNRINSLTLDKAENQLQNQILQKKIEADKSVQMALELGETTLKAFGPKEDVLDEQGNVIEQKRTKEKELPYDLSKLDENPYTDDNERETYDAFRKHVSENIQSVRELNELQERYKNIKELKINNEKSYNKITSKEYQKSLKFESKLEQDFKSKLSELESLKGTDQYMPFVENLMSKYKGKINDQDFNRIKRKYQFANEYKKAADEIAKQEYINNKYSDEEQEEKQVTSKEIEEQEGKDIRSEAVADEINVDTIARKLNAGASLKDLSKAEQSFYVNYSSQIDKKKTELSSGGITPNEDNSDVEINPELSEKGNDIVDLISTVSGTHAPVVKPLTQSNVEKIVTETKQETLTAEETIALGKFKGNQIQKPLLNRQLGANFQTVINSLKEKGFIKEEGNNYVKVLPVAIVSGSTVTIKSEAEIIADQLLAKEFTYAGEGNYQLLVPELNDEQDNKNLKDAIDVIKNKIKNNILSGWSVSDKKIFGKNTFIISKPSTEGISAQPDEISYQPNELNENIPAEKLEQLKDLVLDYVETMESEDGKFPTFEEFVKSFIKNVGKQQAEDYLKALGKGWELNGYGKITNYDAIVNKLFKSLKEKGNILSQLSSELTTESIPTAEESRVETTEQATKEDSSTNKIPVALSEKKEPIYDSSSFLSDSSEITLAFNNFDSVRNISVDVTEEGDVKRIFTEYETSQELKDSGILKSNKLLNYDNYQKGEDLEIVVPESAILSKILMPLRIEDKTNVLYGSPILDDKGKKILVPYGKWLNEKLATNPDFKNTQEYWDSIPMLAKDKDGDYVAMIHEPIWYNDKSAYIGDVEKAQLENRQVRKGVRSAMENGQTYKVKILSNTGGLYSPLVVKTPVKLSSTNPDAKVALLIKDKDGNKVLIYNNKPVTEKVENFEVELKRLKDSNNSKAVIAYDLRRWGTDENGNATYKMFPSTRPTLNEDQVDTVNNLIVTYLTYNNKKISDLNKSKYLQLITKIETTLGLGQGSFSGNFDKILGNYIVLNNSLPSKPQIENLQNLIKEGDIKEAERIFTAFFKNITSDKKQGLPYITTFKGSIVFGLTGGDFKILTPSMMNVVDNKVSLSPEVENKLEDLQKTLAHAELNISTKFEEITPKEKPLGTIFHINNDLSLNTVANSYYQYLADNMLTYVKSVSINTPDGTKYVTRIQPSIKITPIGVASRKENQVNVTYNDVTEKDKQKISNIIESVSDEKLSDAVDEMTQDGFDLFGDTTEEKVQDLKTVVKQMSDESKEVVEKYVEPKADVNDISEFTEFLKQADNQVKWVNSYLNEDYNEDISYQPQEISDEDVKEMDNNLLRIDGINSKHQNQISNHVSVKIGKLVIDGKINQEQLRNKVNEELNSSLGANKEIIKENLAKLKEIPNGDKIQQVVNLIKKYELALSKIDLVLDNSQVIYDQALSMVLKDLNGKIVEDKEDEKGNKEIDIKDPAENEINEDEEDEEDKLSDEEDRYLGTENYSKTSLEVNPKSSVSYTLRRFMRGIPDINANTGLPKTGAMGTPLYVNFDTAFDTVQSILADTPVDFKVMMDILKLNQDKQPWLPELISKLQSSSNEIKNQFTSAMGKHALNMEFLMYSFSDAGVSLIVTNTNSSAIKNKIYKTWRNNLESSSPLVNEFGEVQMDMVDELYEDFKSWTSTPSVLKSEFVKKLNFAIEDGKFDLTESMEKYVSKGLVDTLKTKDRKFEFKGRQYKVSLSGDKITIRPLERNIVGQAITNYSNLTLQEQQQAVLRVGAWLEAFGIELKEKAIESIFKNGIYHKGTLVNTIEFFDQSPNSKGAIGLLANWLLETKSTPLKEGEFKNINNEDDNPLNQSAIENTLATLDSRFSDNVVTPAFRDGKKSIYGFTARKFVTDRVQDLKTDKGLRDNLKQLSFNKHSLWLQFFEDEESLSGWSFNETFGVSHLGLTAFKEYGKPIYKDNQITSLSDIDHEGVKIGMFQDLKQGQFTKQYKVANDSFKLRTARFFSPTNSDKTTMPVIKTMALMLTERRLFQRKGLNNELIPNESIMNLLFEQTVLPEIERILNHNKKDIKSNIKNYDKGAKMFLFMPSLNELVVDEVDGKKITLRDTLLAPKASLDKVLSNKDAIIKEVENYVTALVKEKMKVWENNGYYVSFDVKQEDGSMVKEARNKFLDSKYLKSIDGASMMEKIEIAALDFEINQLIANSNSFMTIIGDPALYYKVDESERSKTFVEKSQETFVNVGKRLAAMIAPGTKLADSDSEQYTQVMLNDRVALSENINFLTQILDNKTFNREKYNEIKNRKSPSEDPMVIKEFELEREADMKAFYAEYPNSNGYFDIEGTDAQEYTTWQEHLHILEKLGRLNDATVGITPEEIRIAKEMFANGTEIDKMSDKQKGILKKVLQPIKPVYTGQVFDKANDVMRMVYIKSSSFPLIPQVTEGTDLNKLREVLEELQKEGAGDNPSPYKYVRASYQTANKVGAVAKGLNMYNGDGSIKDIKVDELKQSSLTLNRKDFKIQLDVPYKSYKRIEDEVSVFTQLNKILFGNGMMEEQGFSFEGALVSGRKLEEEFTKAYLDLVNLKKQQLFDELGINPVTGESYDVYKTANKLQKILKTEALNRGYSKQDIEALELEVKRIKYKDKGEVDDVSFKLPIWLSPNADKFESLLNAIVNNRINKLKFPGNSYVAGSEEGFKFQTNFKGVKKNKIVWTSSWNNQSLQAAKFDEKGNLKYTQVLAPSKFKKADGTLIDLLEYKDDKYTYVTKTDTGFRLKEDMMDAELRNLISVRIPTSGHKSGAIVEIVGFLPNEVGDLMIVPRNITKQKGLDFDVDKENTYQLWHEIDEDGKIKVLKDGDKEKKLQNKIIDIHKSVYSNPRKSVQKKINGILSMEYAKEQADLIDGWINKTKDNTYFTPLSSEYQKQKMFLGSSGKLGTGAYSLDVTSQSLFEQAKSKGTPLSANTFTIVNNEPDYINYSVKFGEEPACTGILGESTTLDGERTIAEVLEELQNIALDNEKEQVMGRVNLNSHTLEVSKAMAMLGFDKSKETGNSIQFVFLSQPIIVDYVKEMNNSNSNLSDFNINKEAIVLDKLFKKYGNPNEPYSVGYEKDVDNNSLLSMKTLEEQLKTNAPDFSVQLAVLNRFIQLKNIGSQLRKVQTSINVDSKGLGKSIPENLEKINSILTVISNPVIQNADKLIGDFKTLSFIPAKEIEDGTYIKFGSVYLKPTTVSGAFIANSLTAVDMLWSKHFPYNSQVISMINAQLMPLISSGEASDAKKAERRKIILKEVKKYINALNASDTLFDNTDAQAERERLFFDRGDEKQSLATYVKELVKSGSSLKYNALLQRLEFNINNDGQPSTLRFNNASSGSYDETAINDALFELMELNLNLKSFNGEPYTSRKLAQDLVSYAMLEGGVQEVIQFVKYIPISYLDKMGFTLGMSEMDFNSNDMISEFGINPNDLNKLSSFAIQFAQHNPNILPKIDIIAPVKPELLEKSSFTYEELIGSKEGDEPVEYSYFPLVSMRKNGKYYIWKVDGNTFTKISTAGTFGMSEYTKNTQVIKSLIDKIDVKPVTTQPLPGLNSDAKTLKEQRFGLSGQDLLTDIITKVANSTTIDPYLSNLAKQLLPSIDSSTSIKVEKIKDGVGTYNRTTNVITIDINQARNASDTELARTILKELVHSITDNEIGKYVYRNSEDNKYYLKTNNAPSHISELVKLFNQVSKSPDFQKALTVIKQKRNEQRLLTEKENRVYYGGYDVFEFIEMMMTQPEFQLEMAKTKVNDRNSLLDLFRNFVTNLFKNLGVSFENDTVAAQAIENIFIMIDEKGKVKKETQPEVKPATSNKFNKKNIFTVTPIQSADKKAIIKANIATQFIGFGEGITNSSTELYRQQAGQYANTGNYSSNDVIFVSIGGKRGNEEVRKEQQDKTIKETIKAIEAGATILTDNKSYIESSDYNEGEKRLYKNLEAKGYNYSEITVNGQVIGTWSKPTTTTQPSTTSEKSFTTKVDQFTYTYNPVTKQVIHNAKAGDKIETNETQINKVLAAYAKANNFETKVFNKQEYVQIDDKVLNVNTGSRVTQKEIVDLFASTVSNSIKSDLLKVFEEIQDDIKNDRDVDFVDVNFNDFRGYPNIQEYFNNPYGVESREYEFIKANKDTVEELLKTLPEKDAISLIDKLKSETDFENLQLSSDVTPILSNDTSKEEKLLDQVMALPEMKKYELFPDVFANKEQTEALDKLEDFLNTPRDKSQKNQSTFVLVGRGGTGKTTIIKKILTNNDRVVGTAISHNAKNNLSRSLKGKPVVTIASLLGFKEKVNKDNKLVFEPDPKFDVTKSPIGKAKVLVVDECSMIDKKVMDRIYQLAPADCKIIFMGDNVQAPPIESKEDSQTFTAATKPEYNAKLVERMRQGEESPIVPLSDIIAANVEKPENERQRRVINRRISQFNPITNQGLLFADSQTLYSELQKDLVADIQNTKIISYTNATRKRMNEVARKMIWGEEGAKFEYNVGEILVSNDLKAEDKVINGEYYKVLSVKETPNAVNINTIEFDGRINVVNKSFPGYKLTVEVLSEGDFFGQIITFNLPKKANKQAIDEIQESLRNSRNWKLFFENRDNIFDIDYGYSITSHKSQGSTFNNTYVIEDDILESNMGIKEANQLLYVAVTRPKNKLVMYSKYNPSLDQQIISEEEKQRAKPTGISYQPREELSLPKYSVNKNLQNADGSKRFANTSKDGVITINPVTSTKEFFDYFEGKEGGITSQQKAKVLEQLSNQGWSLDRIKSVLKDPETINNFLVLHEQSHVKNKDIDVYWSMGKDLLTEDKIKIEARATIDALTEIENASEEVNQKIKSGVDDVFDNTSELSSIGTKEQYSQYLDTIFPDSKVKDIVYHGSNSKIEKFDTFKSKVSDVIYFSNDIKEATYYANKIPDDGIFIVGDYQYTYLRFENKNYYLKKEVKIGKERLSKEEAIFKYSISEKEYKEAKSKLGNLNPSLINIKNLYQGFGEDLFFGGAESFKQDGYDGFITNNDAGQPSILAVFEPEQIHMLGSKDDIKGFKEFVEKQSTQEVKEKVQQTQKDVVSSAIENQIEELIRKGIIKAKCD